MRIYTCWASVDARTTGMPHETQSAQILAFFRGPREQRADATGVGPLQDLPGTWEGRGVRLLALPGERQGSPDSLQLDATREAIAFASIKAAGMRDPSAGTGGQCEGVHYVHEAHDASTSVALHRETGIWLDVVTEAAEPMLDGLVSAVDRNAVPATGTTHEVHGGVPIPTVSTLPVDYETREALTGGADRYAAPRLPDGVPAGVLADPNVILREQAHTQRILRTTVLSLTAELDDGPLHGAEPAGAATGPASIEATWWIQTLTAPGRSTREVLQLQYSRTTLHCIDGVGWPQITVATLHKR